jgi:hypothetical protein
MHGFPTFVRDAVQRQAEEDGEGDLPQEEQGPSAINWKFIPDAFAVDEAKRVVTALEIIETHDIDERKAACISTCFWRLDYAQYDLHILLFYPSTHRSLIVDNLASLDFRALKLQSLRRPCRDAFQTLKRPVREELHRYKSQVCQDSGNDLAEVR